jgi:hypothetical protein
MNNDPIEGPLRDALAAHAQKFSASPDAWQQVQAKDASLSRLRPGRSGPPGVGWLARHSGFVIPAAAAAAVAAVALGAAALGHGFSGTTGQGAPAHPAAGKPTRGSTPVWCAGQCGPPYELMVLFQPGTTHAAAQQLLTSCTNHNPVVIRVGPLGVDPAGLSRAFIYTQVFGPRNPSRTAAGLLTCLRHSSLTYEVGWPD